MPFHTWLEWCYLSAMRGNQLSSTHQFLEDVASSTVSNHWTSRREGRNGFPKTYGDRPLLSKMSTTIHRSPVYTLHQCSLRKWERTGPLFSLPSHCPTNIRVLRKSKMLMKCLIHSTAHTQGHSISTDGCKAIKIHFLILNRMENPHNILSRKIKPTNLTIKSYSTLY